MTADMRVYLDTNIFIYAFDRPVSVDTDISNALIELLALNDGSRPPFLFTSELTFAELWVGAYKRNDDELITVFENLSVTSGFLEVGPVTLDVFRYAAITRAQNPAIKLPDAIHLSTAVGFECTHFLTADKGLSGPFVLTHTRHRSSRTSPEIEIARPDLETIHMLTGALSSHD